MKWIEITLHAPVELQEAVTSRLFDLGAEGVCEEGRAIRGYFRQPLAPNLFSELRIYLAAVGALFPNLPKVEASLNEIPDSNWAENWKRSYKAQKLSHVFFLKPAWDTTTKVPEEMIPIIMEPGQAFGTGLHASTRLCIRLIEHIVEFFPSSADLSVLDVGTGSGILSIVAARLGVRKVIATDIDPQAVETAVANLERNDCSWVQVKSESIEKMQGSFDIIVANILLETHLQLANDYKRLLNPRGYLVISGLLSGQREPLVQHFAPLGLGEELSELMQEWEAVALTHRRPQ
ncbi:MAG: 50S ribosomal protein L11 methyltransferase [Deltaproteobacteria bacterium]|nr:50S ribosomal protein L11 methyltransferase [Deltaproteobacteria bacterium]